MLELCCVMTGTLEMSALPWTEPGPRLVSDGFAVVLGAVVCASTAKVVSAAKLNEWINSSRALRQVGAPQLKAFEHPKIGAMFKPEHIRQKGRSIRIGVERQRAQNGHRTALPRGDRRGVDDTHHATGLVAGLWLRADLLDATACLPTSNLGRRSLSRHVAGVRERKSHRRHHCRARDPAPIHHDPFSGRVSVCTRRTRQSGETWRGPALGCGTDPFGSGA